MTPFYDSPFLTPFLTLIKTPNRLLHPYMQPSLYARIVLSPKTTDERTNSSGTLPLQRCHHFKGVIKSVRLHDDGFFNCRDLRMCAPHFLRTPHDYWSNSNSVTQSPTQCRSTSATTSSHIRGNDIKAMIDMTNSPLGIGYAKSIRTNHYVYVFAALFRRLSSSRQTNFSGPSH